MLYLYVEDVDALFERAVAAGGAVVRAVEDQPYGDRVGAVSDPAGNQWWIATRKETLSSAEIAERMSEGGAD
jgi:PhnB protein